MTGSISWPRKKCVSVVADPPGWFTPYAQDLASRLSAAGMTSHAFGRQEDVAIGTIAFYLSCTGITKPEQLARNAWNIVVHASDLPKGRGFSPLVWQILDEKNFIPVTMIAMTDTVDAGDILMQRHLAFHGYELNDEMRDKMGEMIVDMCFDMATSADPPIPRPQHGEPSWYKRRRANDSELDPQKTIEEQFNLLRVVDNEAYPAFFTHQGHRYTLTITRQTDKESDK